MLGTFAVTAGSILNIGVGQKGIDATSKGGGGGGGASWIALNSNLTTPYVVAGAGGGGQGDCCGVAVSAKSASLTNDSTVGVCGGCTGATASTGGAGGKKPGTGCDSGGGGGWVSNGVAGGSLSLIHISEPTRPY